jgi:hypothetical protein
MHSLCAFCDKKSIKMMAQSATGATMLGTYSFKSNSSEIYGQDGARHWDTKLEKAPGD